MHEPGELRYRLALRAALWADQKPASLSRLEVFDLMRKAYDLRSVVVHGSEPSEKDLRMKGQMIPLELLVESTAGIVRAGIMKAIRDVKRSGKNKFDPAWEAMVLKG